MAKNFYQIHRGVAAPVLEDGRTFVFCWSIAGTSRPEETWFLLTDEPLKDPELDWWHVTLTIVNRSLWRWRQQIKETALVDSERRSCAAAASVANCTSKPSPGRAERSVGNRAAPGFDSDGSRDDKQTPQRIRSVLGNPGRRLTARLIVRDERLGGGGQTTHKRIKIESSSLSWRLLVKNV